VFTGANGEVTVDTSKDTLVIHDGTTQGGFPLARESDIPTGALASLNSVGASQIDADAVGSSEIAADAVGSSEIAADSVNSEHYVNGSVDDVHISGMAASKLTGALPAIDGSALTGNVGKVLQMKYTSQSQNLTTTSTNKVSVISVSITPKSSTSKLKVSLHSDFQQLAGNDAHIWLARNDGAGIYNAITDGTWSTTNSNDQAMWQYHYRGSIGTAVRPSDEVWVMNSKVTTVVTIEVFTGVVGSGNINIGANNPRQQLIVEEIEV